MCKVNCVLFVCLKQIITYVASPAPFMPTIADKFKKLLSIT